MRALAVLSGLFLVVLAVQSDLVLPQQTQPPLDISGIKEIQSIPVGGYKTYISGTKNRMPMEQVIDSIANLAVMQMDMENFDKAKDPVTGKEITIIGGEFGRILRREILGFDPKTEGLGVKHIELKKGIRGFDEDKFELDINGRFFDLILAEDFGRKEKGFEKWGVWVLIMRRPLNDGTKRTEEKGLSIDIDKKLNKYVAYYVHTILTPGGTVERVIQNLKFIQGEPNPISQS